MYGRVPPKVPKTGVGPNSGSGGVSEVSPDSPLKDKAKLPNDNSDISQIMPPPQTDHGGETQHSSSNEKSPDGDDNIR
jgi:hypothetical protein